MQLISTANDGDVATVEKLLKAGAKVDRGAYNVHEAPTIIAPLMAAANAGHATVIAVLLKAGAKMNRTTTGGLTPQSVCSRTVWAQGGCIGAR